MKALFDMRPRITKSNAFSVARERMKDLRYECATMARCNGMFRHTILAVNEYINKLDASLSSVKDPNKITDAEFKAIVNAYDYPIMN